VQYLKHLRQAFIIGCILIASLLQLHAYAQQNVGINKTNPQATLDVGGFINVDSIITVNGTTGQPGQVLTATPNNRMAWQDPAQAMAGSFQYFATYTTPGSGTFTVPDGVNRIMVELWGGEGGGTWTMGGGSGAYVAGIFTVSEGQILGFTVGAGGTGAANSLLTSSSTAGTASTIAVLSTTLSAEGGGGVSFNTAGNYANAPNVVGGLGGTYSQTAGPAYRRWFGITGNNGKLYDLSTYKIVYGAGGNAPNWPEPTGGEPAITVTGGSGESTALPGAAARVPGGGGGSGGYLLGPSGDPRGLNGAGGMVRI